MQLIVNNGAAVPNPTATARPTSDEAQAGTNGLGSKDHKTSDKSDFCVQRHAGQALRVIDGEAKGSQDLARLQALQADPDELAVIVSMLYGAALRGFCLTIGKALGVRHG